MRIAIIGANGQLGADLRQAFSGHTVIPWTRTDFDVRDTERARDAILRASPDAVINTAAFHKTDACEDEPDLAFAVNAVAVRGIALACRQSGAALVHVSTDFVFGGDKHGPYTEHDIAAPLNVYGVSKLAGEHFVRAICDRYYNVRVASLFGVAGSSGKGGNFVESMLAKARKGDPLVVVDDVTMSPTFAADAASTIRTLLEARAPSGTYHATNAGACTWHAFTAEILRRAGVSADLRPTSIETMAPKAARPRNSALSSARLPAAGLPTPRSWDDALGAYFQARQTAAAPV
jgi:dTDP-4-dehydrorhamnose reductase